MTAVVLIGVIAAILGLFGIRLGKRWVRREIARAFRELTPFQPTTFIVTPDESNSDDSTEG